MSSDKTPESLGTVRITAGKAKNFRLEIPRKTRALTDRMKTRIFDILRDDIVGLAVLDLYAGSGSFGLEALSRGAENATFVDAAKGAEKILNENFAKTGFLTQAEAVRMKVEDFLSNQKESKSYYELIFIDPPYKLYNKKDHRKINKILEDAAHLLPGFNDPNTKLFKGVLILKHPTEYDVSRLRVYGIRLLESFGFGVNTISFYVVD
ncbi:RsmD family RNA methyltransferase [Candidatus Nomurabacteria bacterium]|nr:RsmD family RNA methyltransferase [Candidatus Nomurabacteria bacterium]